MPSYVKLSLGRFTAFSAILATITTWLSAPLASAYVVGSCYGGKQCSGQKLADIDVVGGPGDVVVFSTNCPTYYAAFGKPQATFIKLCHTINGKECSNCVTVNKGQCYPVSPIQQWVGLCFGEA